MDALGIGMMSVVDAWRPGRLFVPNISLVFLKESGQPLMPCSRENAKKIPKGTDAIE